MKVCDQRVRAKQTARGFDGGDETTERVKRMCDDICDYLYSWCDKLFNTRKILAWNNPNIKPEWRNTQRVCLIQCARITNSVCLLVRIFIFLRLPNPFGWRRTDVGGVTQYYVPFKLFVQTPVMRLKHKYRMPPHKEMRAWVWIWAVHAVCNNTVFFWGARDWNVYLLEAQTARRCCCRCCVRQSKTSFLSMLCHHITIAPSHQRFRNVHTYFYRINARISCV